MRAFFVTAGLLLALLAACGGSELGDSCTHDGDISECDDHLVCGKRRSSDELVCLKQCKEDADCGRDENCNGTEGSLKACRPKS